MITCCWLLTFPSMIPLYLLIWSALILLSGGKIAQIWTESQFSSRSEAPRAVAQMHSLELPLITPGWPGYDLETTIQKQPTQGK